MVINIKNISTDTFLKLQSDILRVLIKNGYKNIKTTSIDAIRAEDFKQEFYGFEFEVESRG